VLVSRDDDLKRAPEVTAFLAEHGIRVLSVQQFLYQGDRWTETAD
jgi:hypothetical protein